MTRLCFVDVEGTGTDPAIHEAWEIAIIVRDTATPSTGDREYAWQVRPDLRTADTWTVRASRLYPRLEVGQPGNALVVAHAERSSVGGPMLAHHVADDIAALVAGAVFVAIRPALKAALLQKFLTQNFECGTWHPNLVDALSLAAGRLLGRGQDLPPPWRSTTITDALGIAAEKDRPTALGDARIVRDIWDKVTNGD